MSGCTDDGICTVKGCLLCAASQRSGEKSLDQNAVVHGGQPRNGFEMLTLVQNPHPHLDHVDYRDKIAR